MSQKSTPKWQPWWGATIAAIAVSGTVSIIGTLGGFGLLEMAAYDTFVRWREPKSPDSRIVIVGIDEPDVVAAGQWPMSDETLALLIEEIAAQEPIGIGLDLYRDLPVPPGSDRLNDVMANTENLIGVEKLLGVIVAPPPILAEDDRVALSDLIADADGKVRRALMSAQDSEGIDRLGLGPMLALMYLEKQGIFLKNTNPNDPGKMHLRLGQALFVPLTGKEGPYRRRDVGGYQIIINYYGQRERFSTVGMEQVLKGNISPNLFRDRIVLIGATALSLNDFFYTPYSTTFSFSEKPTQMPGVVLHANITSQMLSAALDGRSLVRPWSHRLEWILIAVWSAIGTIVGWSFRWNALSPLPVSPFLILGLVPFLGISIVAIAYISFAEMGWWLPVFSPLLALLGATFFTTIYAFIVVQQDNREMLMLLFERHVTAKVARAIWDDRRQLLASGRLPGQRVTATILFTDLKGFTTIAECTEPEVLMDWLNEYTSAMTEAVLDYDGVVDKFIGDAVMAAFGVPVPHTEPEAIAADARAAIDCAIDMGRRLQSLNKSWQQRGLPTVAMRVGIATGPVVAGSIGGVKRLDYTTIGDTVNVASRLES